MHNHNTTQVIHTLLCTQLHHHKILMRVKYIHTPDLLQVVPHWPASPRVSLSASVSSSTWTASYLVGHSMKTPAVGMLVYYM